jgi:hypothetical protein
VQVELVTADVQQAAGVREAPPLQCRGDALIGRAGEDEKEERGARCEQRSFHYDSDSPRPYFSMRE